MVSFAICDSTGFNSGNGEKLNYGQAWRGAIPILHFRAVIHALLCHRLEFDGLYLAEQPADDDIKALWDKLVISASSFPDLYWDKFVKKRVRQKYSKQFEFDDISNTLGMEKSALKQEEDDKSGFVALFMSIDWRYQLWKAGVTMTENVSRCTDSSAGWQHAGFMP